MDATDPIVIWGNISLLLMALGFNIFAVYYGIRIRWEATEIGPAVLTLFTFLALTLDYFFAAAWFGDFAGRYIIRAVLLTLAAGAVFWHLGWLMYAQRRYRSGTVKTGGQDGQVNFGSVGDAVADDRWRKHRSRSDLEHGSGSQDPRP